MEFVWVAVGFGIGVAVGFLAVRPQLVRLRTQLEERSNQLNSAQSSLDSTIQSAQELQKDLSSAEADVLRYKSVLDERERAEKEHKQQLEAQFKGLASDVLRSTATAFREQASDQFSQQRELVTSEFKAREAAITGLTDPIKEGLESLRRHVNESDKERSATSAQMRDQVERMISETSMLRDVLHNPQLRGQWGEQNLQNVLEIAGMRKHVDFIPQGLMEADGRSRRPDVVVNIPGGIEVIIDAKTPHEIYHKAITTTHKDQRKLLLEKHAAALAGHVKELGGRDYSRWSKSSPDFVIMYVPTDPILDAAMEARPAIWHDAMKQHKVLIATPGLLIAFLRTVAMAWQQESVQKNAQEIADAALELYHRLRKFAEHLSQVGKSLDSAVTHYNKSVGSFDKRLIVQARKFESLGVTGELDSLNSPNVVEGATRKPHQLAERSASGNPPGMT